jgi:hypothetical protein
MNLKTLEIHIQDHTRTFGLEMDIEEFSVTNTNLKNLKIYVYISFIFRN